MRSALVEQHELLVAAIERAKGLRTERAMQDHVLSLDDIVRRM